MTNTEELKELKSIRKLLTLLLLKGGTTSEEIDKALGIGSGNIRTMFSGVKKGFLVEYTSRKQKKSMRG